MYCLRCGREIPDGELFCRSCARTPIARQEAAEKQTPPLRTPEAAARPAAPKKAAPQQQTDAPRRRSRLIVPLILALLLCAGLAAGCWYLYRQMSLQRANYRVKEANLTLRENELSGLSDDYEAAQAELETAQAELAARDAEIEDLQATIREHESAMSQSEYDFSEAQKTIETLTAENETLTAELDSRTQDAAAVQSQLDGLTSRYELARAKAEFLDAYVVFVNNDGSGLYHSYICANFTKSNFWAYSRKLAENYGFTACPVCGG